MEKNVFVFFLNGKCVFISIHLDCPICVHGIVIAFFLRSLEKKMVSSVTIFIMILITNYFIIFITGSIFRYFRTKERIAICFFSVLNINKFINYFHGTNLFLNINSQSIFFLVVSSKVLLFMS